MHCECFIVLKSPVINNRYSDSLYSGTRSEGNGATGGVVVTSSCLGRIFFMFTAGTYINTCIPTCNYT